MPLTELLPTVRLIHFLLLVVAKEEGCNLETTKVNSEHNLLTQLASTRAVVWSPQADVQAVTALTDLLKDAKEKANA